MQIGRVEAWALGAEGVGWLSTESSWTEAAGAPAASISASALQGANMAPGQCVQQRPGGGRALPAQERGGREPPGSEKAPLL